MKNQVLNSHRGIATLPMVLLIGGLLAELGIVGLFMAYFMAQSGFGARLSEEALAAARAGVADAEMKIIRDTNFSPSPNPYSLTVGNYSAQITVCKNLKTVSGTCDTPMPDKFEITSLGNAITKQRKIQAIVNIDINTGEIEVESEKEIPL